MYLEYFGLKEQPFKITPVTEFFFSGADRKDILDALIYSISDVEGITMVSGEVGSGKTMLCRILLERLPRNIEPIYLANPSLSREEMLYAIADGLGLNIENGRVGVIMQNIQSKLEQKASEGKRVVVLVDEAHAMPVDTLEELRLLYNLQVGNFKLLQIVLFGQPELNTKLNQPNMRQLKDRIVHHFNMHPLTRHILQNYLMFRMRAAGYHGPDIFSAGAIRLLANASSGLMRRANVLADKSLLAAFIENSHEVRSRHVRAAMRDSEIEPLPARFKYKPLWAGAAVAALLLLASGIWWLLAKPQSSPPRLANQTVPAATQADAPGNSSSLTAPADTPKVSATPTQPASVASGDVTAPLAPSKPAQTEASLFEQRLDAGKQLLAGHQAVASIQLFHYEQVPAARLETFLQRADSLGKLAEIYLIPAKFGDKNGLRVLYGSYSSAEEARNAIQYLPPRYLKAFTPSVFVFTGS